MAQAKRVVIDAWSGGRASPQQHLFTDDVDFHGPAPIGRVGGCSELFSQVYGPLKRAMPHGRRRCHLFLGGVWNDQTWVAATGNLVGAMADSWLVFHPVERPITVRFGEFYRVEKGRIVEVRCLYDLVAVAEQVGYNLFPAIKRPAIPAGPRSNEGLIFDSSEPSQSAVTLRLVESMLQGCNRLLDDDLGSMGMAAYWHPDMAWYGPAGVGTALGFDEFQTDAQGPSVASFPNRRGGFHQARIADGLTAAFTGWPSMTGTFDGLPFRGIEPTGKRIGQNIMDFYVRRDDKLHLNWVLIDLIDFAAQCGVDLLKGLDRHG